MSDDFSQATPRPWIARNIGEKENYVIGVPDDEGYGDAICFVEEGSHATGGSLHDDARLIVAAVNERDALRRALGDIIKLCPKVLRGERDVVDIAEIAYAALKGGGNG